MKAVILLIGTNYAADVQSTRAFGWVLLALVVVLAVSLYQSWQEGSVSRKQITVCCVLALLVVATVANVWISY